MTTATKKRFEIYAKVPATKDNILKKFPYLKDANLNFSANGNAWVVIDQALDICMSDIPDDTKTGAYKKITITSQDIDQTIIKPMIGKVIASLFVKINDYECNSYTKGYGDLDRNELLNLVNQWLSDLTDKYDNARSNANIMVFFNPANLPSDTIKTIHIKTVGLKLRNGRNKLLFKHGGKLKVPEKTFGNAENFNYVSGKQDQIIPKPITDHDFDMFKHLTYLAINGKVIYSINAKRYQVEKDTLKLSKQNDQKITRKLNRSLSAIETVATVNASSVSQLIQLITNDNQWLNRYAIDHMLSGKITVHNDGLVTFECTSNLLKTIVIGKIINAKQTNIVWHDIVKGRNYSSYLNQNKLDDLNKLLHNDLGYRNGDRLSFAGLNVYYRGKLISRGKETHYVIRKFIPSQKITVTLGKFATDDNAKPIVSEQTKIIDLIDITDTFSNRYVEKFVHNLISKHGEKTNLTTNDNKRLKDLTRAIKTILTVWKPDHTSRNIETIKTLLLAQFNGDIVSCLNYLLPSVTYIKGKHDNSAKHEAIIRDLSYLI